MPTKEEFFAIRERLEEQEKNKGTEEEERRKMIVRVIKSHNGGIEPCEAEIQDNIDYLKKCKENPKYIKEIKRKPEKKSIIEFEEPKE